MVLKKKDKSAIARNLVSKNELDLRISSRLPPSAKKKLLSSDYVLLEAINFLSDRFIGIIDNFGDTRAD